MHACAKYSKHTATACMNDVNSDAGACKAQLAQNPNYRTYPMYFPNHFPPRVLQFPRRVLAAPTALAPAPRWLQHTAGPKVMALTKSNMHRNLPGTLDTRPFKTQPNSMVGSPNSEAAVSPVSMCPYLNMILPCGASVTAA
jgi:hypothetical protein